MAELMVDEENGVTVLDEVGVDVDDAFRAFAAQEPELATMVKWHVSNQPSRAARDGGMLDRDRYVSPRHYFDQVATAQHAAEYDDVISGAIESTEALAFSRVSVDTDDEDECVDDQTEILTLNGWVTHEDLRVGDFILTLNKETGRSEWLPVLRIGRYDAPEKLARMVGRNFDALVTPNHRWLVRTGRPQSPLRFVETRDLTTTHRIPLGAPAGASPVERPIVDAFVELAGWFVTEGWFEDGTTRCAIGQSSTINPDNCSRIVSALDALGVDYRIDDRSDGLRRWSFGGEIARQLRDTFPHKRLTREFVNSIAVSQRAILMRALIDGDGHASSGSSEEFTTVELEQAEAFEHLCYLMGYATSRYEIEPGHESEIDGRKIVSKRRKYVVHRFATKQAKIESLECEYVHSEPGQIVWCPSTPNGTFLARRNGHVYFTGNTNIWNQIAEDIDLDARLREIWREDFSIGSATCAVWYGTRDYKVRGRSKESGVARKKQFKRLIVPRGISVLDPLKVVPVGNLMFGREMMAYAADENGEHDIIQAVLNGEREDPLIRQLLLRPYIPDHTEKRLLGNDSLPVSRLWLMNPERIFRHSATRPQYQRFAPVRLKSLFELLDLKRQLRGRDRAHLIGATNYIVLIKKGTDDKPAKPAEIQNLQSGVKRLAQVPVIVGDHRLSIEIITPKADNTLAPEVYNGIDARIAARVYQLIMTGNFAAGAKGDDSIKLAKFMSKGLESRRSMIAKTIERNVLRPTFEKNDQLTEVPAIRYHPKRIALDLDPAFMTMLQDLRDRGDLSRESLLEEADFDQHTEFKRRLVEQEHYDETFQSGVINPWGGGDAGDSNSDAPPADPRSGGRRGGGLRNGGGAAPGSGQGQPAKNPAKKSDGRDRPNRS